METLVRAVLKLLAAKVPKPIRFLPCSRMAKKAPRDRHRVLISYLMNLKRRIASIVLLLSTRYMHTTPIF